MQLPAVRYSPTITRKWSDGFSWCYAVFMRADLEDAMVLLRSEDPAQLGRVLQLLQNTVFSFSMRVCGHREDAEDTAQEVLVKAIPYLHQFENAKALTAWLYTVARNRCWMSRRRSKYAPSQHLSLDELMPDAGELDRLMAAGERSPENAVIQAEDKQRLQDAILRVPPQYRLVLVLHDIEELSTEEISKVLGITEGNVRVRLHRARLFVRRELAQEAFSPDKAADSAGPPVSKSAKCRRIFSNLSNYMDGALDESLCEQLQLHLKGCKPCEAFLTNLKLTVEALHGLPTERPEPQAASTARARALARLGAAGAQK